MKKAILCGALGSLLLTSCFKDEPLNSEADILQASISLSEEKIQELFFNESDTLINVLSDDKKIIFTIKDEKADVSALAPKFVTTAGATMSPASGSVQDFSKGPVTYTVTSQDGAYKRTYEVSFVYNELSNYYGLESPIIRSIGPGTAFAKNYYEWDGLCSANAGYMYVAGADPTEYPTIATENGYIGKGALLRTMDTGSWGVSAGKRIAAGNIFLGKFDTTKALLQTLKATLFGIPVNQEPTGFSCWYKYTPGKDYKDAKGNLMPGKVDHGDIYAVVYRNHDEAGNPVTLTGDNILTSPLIIGIAQLEEALPSTSEWTYLHLDIKYSQGFNPNILKNRGYSFAFVASASYRGDYFEGAEGSELYIDEINFYFK